MMVATKTHNPDRFAQPLVMNIAGQPRSFETKQGVFDSLRELERTQITHTLRAAEACFHLGAALLEAKRKLGYGSMNHLYGESGINARRAQRAIRFAEKLDDGQGGFSIPKYRAIECEARNRHERGERTCRIDANGDPSFTAVLDAAGVLTKGAKTAQNDTGVVLSNGVSSDPQVGTRTRTNTPIRSMDEVMAEFAGTDRHFKDHRAFTATGTAGVPREAAQLELDFDLDATGDTLADTAHRAASLQRSGGITHDQAARADAVLRDAHTRVQDIINHTGS